jgi:three-Cys-motif partner protein
MANGKAHEFGGDWTSKKLEVLSGYLAAYTTALKNRPFRKAYIDAFAGTGYRTDRSKAVASGIESLTFPDLAEEAPQELLDGSARLALKVDGFDRYIFIEQRKDRCRELELLKYEFPERGSDIRIRQGDANQEIQELCSKGWTRHRAVLFLDPYGTQVHWETIKAVAATEAIDMWLLFPLGVGVNRMLPRSGDVPRTWKETLDRLLGTDDWYEEFYSVERENTLFGPEERVVKASTDVIGRYFNDRLKTAFAGVAEKPGVLRNSANCPLYLFCFAAANPKGAPIALDIANHLLKGLR